MNKTLTIILFGEPVANARHRMTRTGISYTEPKTASERNRLKEAAERQMIAAGIAMFTGPLDVKHRVERPMLKSFSKKKYAAALSRELLPTSRPDFDNYAKMVDALNGIVWKDDAQICHYEMWKVFSEQPKVVFQITAIQE